MLFFLVWSSIGFSQLKVDDNGNNKLDSSKVKDSVISKAISLDTKRLDSIPDDNKALEKQSKYKLTFNFDARFSWIDNYSVRIGGFKAGLEKGSNKFGIGFYFLGTPLRYKILPPKIKGQEQDSIDANMKFDYFAFYYAKIWYKKGRWEISTPIQIGLGNTSYEFLRKNGAPRSTRKNKVGILEPTIEVQYKLLQWIGLSTGLGYRLTLFGEQRSDRKLEAPIVIAKVRFLPVPFFKSMFNGTFWKLIER